MPTKAVALITGANRGIGFEIARQLGEQDFTVWLACRNAGRAESAAARLRGAGVEAHVVVLDVTSDESVAAAAARVSSETHALDVLVNNAGMNFGPPGDVRAETVDDMRVMFETNALGPVRVTQAFLPLLRKSKAASVVMASSGLGSHAMTTDMTSENWTVGFAGYCASKSALNMFALKFAKELLAEGIKVNIADPGLTKTDLGGPMATRPPAEGARAAVQLATSTLNAYGPTAGFFFREDSTDRLSQHPW